MWMMDIVGTPKEVREAVKKAEVPKEELKNRDAVAKVLDTLLAAAPETARVSVIVSADQVTAGDMKDAAWNSLNLRVSFP